MADCLLGCGQTQHIFQAVNIVIQEVHRDPTGPNGICDMFNKAKLDKPVHVPAHATDHEVEQLDAAMEFLNVSPPRPKQRRGRRTPAAQGV